MRKPHAIVNGLPMLRRRSRQNGQVIQRRLTGSNVGMLLVMGDAHAAEFATASAAQPLFGRLLTLLPLRPTAIAVAFSFASLFERLAPTTSPGTDHG